MRIAIRLFAIALFAMPLSAQVQMHWNAVGSTGIIDETSAPHQFTAMSVEFPANVVGTISARYPVVNVWGSIDPTPPWSTLEMAHVDNSPSGTVAVRLVEVDRCTNVETTICSVGSTDGGTATTCKRCAWTTTLDFGQNIYYVELRLSRTSTVALPSLQHVNIQ